MMGRFRTIVALGLLALCVSGCPSPHLLSSQPRSTQALNLTWNGREPNGLSYNPRWAFQPGGAGGQLPLADPEKQCGGFPTTTADSSRHGDPPCTDQDTGVDRPTGWHMSACHPTSSRISKF